MNAKLFKLIITLLFTATMITLTFSSRGIRNHFMLPNVRIERLNTQQYDYNFLLEDGTEVSAKRSALAINKDLYDNIDGLYIIKRDYKNGESRTFVKRVFITINGENETSYFIESGINNSDFLVIESNKPLTDDMEVYICN